MSDATLDAIVAEDAADVAQVAGAVPGAPPAEAAQVQPTLAEEIAGLVTLAVKVLAPVFPSLPGIYTEEMTGAAAGAVGAVCEKHGWFAGGIAGKYGEELAAALVVGPLAVQTYAAMKADIEKRRAIEKKNGQGVAALDQPDADAGPVPVSPSAPGILARG